MTELDLLDVGTSDVKTKVGADYSQVFDQMKSKLAVTQDPKIRQEIIDATLQSVKTAANLDKTDLLTAIKDLNAYQDSVGEQFEGFLKMNEEELGIISSAEKVLKSNEDELSDAEELLRKREAVEPAWYRFSRKKKIRLAKEKVEQVKTYVETAKTGLQSAKDKAQVQYRQRLETAAMETLLEEYKFRSEKTITQLKNREGEIQAAEDESVKALEQASKIHQQALELKEKHEKIAETTEATLKQEQDKLLAITDKQSPEWAIQQKEVVTLQQKLDEEKGLVNSYMNLAASKDSFVQKHNLTIRSLTLLRSNLQSHRAKLKSDTEERIMFYQGYLVALKARNDQELASALDMIGNKTDEAVAETLSKILIGSSKARQEMMENIPKHEQNIANIIASAMEGLHKIREKDKQIKKDFEDRYGINMELQFDTSYDNDENNGDKNATPTGGGKKANESSDLLG